MIDERLLKLLNEKTDTIVDIIDLMNKKDEVIMDMINLTTKEMGKLVHRVEKLEQDKIVGNE